MESILKGTVFGLIEEAINSLKKQKIFPIPDFGIIHPDEFPNIQQLRKLTDYEFALTCLINSEKVNARDKALLTLILKENINQGKQHLLIYNNVIYIDDHCRYFDFEPPEEEIIFMKTIFETFGCISIFESRPRPNPFT